MSPMRIAGGLAIGVLCASLSMAQVAISAHSGLLQFTLGSVFLADKPIHKTATNLVEVKPGQVLRTGSDGKAEVLLTPGVFLRLDNDSSVRMDSNALTNTRVTLLSGTAMVECDELLADNAVAFTVGKFPVELRKKGLYRLDADPPGVATIKGEAFVAGDLNLTVKQKKFVALNAAVPQPEKFKLDKKNDLYAFSKARSEDSVYATGVTSSSLYSAGYQGCTGSAWYLMNGVGMYSYLPCTGMYSNPFGYSFLGLNYGYMWDGPGYYMAPYGYYGYGLYGGGYPGGYAVGGGGGVAAPARSGRQGPVNASNPKNAVRAPVPVYMGPGVHQTRPAPEISSHNAAPGFRSMAGPAVRSSAAFSHPGSSMRAAPDPFGGMPSAAGPMGGGQQGAMAPSPSMRSAPTTMTSRPAPSAAPAASGGGGGGRAGGYSGGGTPGGVRGR